MWQVFLVNKARKDLHSLEPQFSQRIIAKLEETAANPEKHFERLSNSPYWKLRIGDYRAIAVLDFGKNLVEVRRIDHRGKIYKHLKKGRI